MLRDEAIAAGEDLTFEQALQVAQNSNRHSREKELLSLERKVPEFLGSSMANV